MKKVYCFVMPLLLFISSCNEVSNKMENKSEVVQNKDSTKNLKTLLALCPSCNNANLEIPEGIARGLISNFETNYLQDVQDIATIPKSVWIDACYISTMVSYIKANPGSQIDGIRFYWGTNKNRADKVQLFVTPTKNRKPLWPNNINPLPRCVPQFQNYDNDFGGIADPMLKRYNKIHRKTPLLGNPQRDNLSRGVWFPTCVLECISNTIKGNPDNKLNGVFICNAAYSSLSSNVPGQLYANQSTIVIVFSKLDDQGNTVEDFSIGDALFNNFNKELDAKKWIDALNHGELCPNSCGT
jgi:hypothetical protein